MSGLRGRGMTLCPRCNERPRERHYERLRAYCSPCRREYDCQKKRNERAARLKGEICSRCRVRPKVYGRPYCGPCRRAWEGEQRIARPPRPRCTRCGDLPVKRDGLCVMCAPILPSPSIDEYALRRNREET